MAEQTSYRGFTNRETWLAACSVHDDESRRRRASEIARQAAEDSEAPIVEAAEDLRRWFEELRPDMAETSVFYDLMNTALARVDWFQIATRLLEEDR